VEQQRNNCWRTNFVLKIMVWKGIYFVHELLIQNDKFFTLQEFQKKYSLKVNYLYYFQVIVAISSELKRNASQTKIFEGGSLWHVWKSDNSSAVSRSQYIATKNWMRCRDYYKLSFIDSCVFEPTDVSWGRKFSNSFAHWMEEKFYKNILSTLNSGTFHRNFRTGLNCYKKGS